MKKFLFILLTFVILISCDTSKKPKKEEVIIVEETPKVEIIEEVKVKKAVSNVLVKLKRKPCSGDCPVFDVAISKDSILTYNGKKYTNIKGKHTVKLTGNQFDKISSILDKSNFSELNSRYTKSGTKDFAETIISYQGKNVTIRLWKDAPKRLTNIYVFIEDILYDKKYLE